MDFIQSTIIGLIIFTHLALFIVLVHSILGSSMDSLSKTLWILIAGLFPIVGVILYVIVGRKI